LGFSKEKPGEAVLDVYKEAFETEFLQATEIYYIAEASAFIGANTVAGKGRERERERERESERQRETKKERERERKRKKEKKIALFICFVLFCLIL